MLLQQQQQRNKYLQNTVQTATPQQLLIMLYDGAIRFCRQGIEGIKTQDYTSANTGFIRTQDIINEFIITIDRTSPVSESLLQLYEYFNSRLIEANLKKSVEPAEEVLNHLIELKETWVEAAKQYNQMAGQVSETLLNQLNQLSSDLIGRIASCELEDMDAYMEERDALFSGLQQLAPQSELSAEIRSIITTILQQDKVITGRMTELLDTADAEMDKMNKGKRTRSIYESDSYNGDSLFFDTKR